jgi:hypothetical protein
MYEFLTVSIYQLLADRLIFTKIIHNITIKKMAKEPPMIMSALN